MMRPNPKGTPMLNSAPAHRSARAHRLLGSTALLAAVLAAPQTARAQAGAKPEIMVLLGTSRSMELTMGDANGVGVVPVCMASGQAWSPILPPSQRSRMAVVKEVLTGGSTGPYVCRQYAPCSQLPTPNLCQSMASGEDASIPHGRMLCCATPGAGAACSNFVPCAGDTGDIATTPQGGLVAAAEGDVMQYQPGGALIDGNGVIYQTRSEVKWGLMAFDSTPDAHDGPLGQYSYPDTGYQSAQGQVNVLGDGLGRRIDPAIVSPALAVQQLITPIPGRPWRGVFNRMAAEEVFSAGAMAGIINLGIRAPGAPYGGLIGGSIGLNDANRLAFVQEDDASVQSHNIYVAGRLRELVPNGSAPIGPALHDALEYYAREGAVQGGDPSNDCRRRTLVLLTDSGPTNYVGGENCVGDATCSARVPGGTCAQVVDPDTGAAVGVCKYPESFPYKTSADYAASLNAAGVPVFIIGITPKPADEVALRNIAAAGSPGMGPNGAGGYYRVSNASELRDALMKVRNSVAAGTRAHTRPLVILPRKGKGDGNLGVGEDGIRQWRINASTEIPGSGDAFTYGHIQRTDMGCPTVAQRLQDPTLGSMARRTIGYSRFDDVLNLRASDRRIFSRNPNTSLNFTVVGGGGANMFRNDGTVGGLYPLADVRTFTDTAAGAAVINGLNADDQLRFVGNQFNGYFGARGLPNGVAGGFATRALGAILATDLVPITAPALPLTQSGYVDFANANAYRSTLLAAGANDGMLHFFRVDDGFEVMNFVPRAPWRTVKNTVAVKTVDGPIEAGDVAACRKYGVNAPVGCPETLTRDSFRTMVVGGIGMDGANIYGVDITRVTDLANRAAGSNVPGNDAAALTLNSLFNAANADRPYVWDLTPTEEPMLGRAVSRPALTHVRVQDAVRGAVVVGCGDDTAAILAAGIGGTGRCVLVLDASTGALIAKIDDTHVDAGSLDRMTYPMSGSAAVWPRGGIAPAERIYIGDRIGRLWRIDLRSKDPANWKAQTIFPTADAVENQQYTTGRGIVGRPTLFALDSGKLAVLFSTAKAAPTVGGGAIPRAAVVSLTDAVAVVNNAAVFQSTRNWVLQLGRDEISTGEVVVSDQIALFTTMQNELGVCASASGRLYGVHATEQLRNAAGGVQSYTPVPADGRTLTVKPMIPLYLDNGARDGTNGLDLVLPPGRIAYGVTLTEVPSCNPGEASATEAVMNLSDDEQGGRNALRTSDMSVERVQNNSLVRVGFNNSVFASANKGELSLCLTCDKSGKGTGTRRSSVPFASSVSYWGATFTD